MGYRLKPFTMSVRDNNTQEFIDVGLLGSDVEHDIDVLDTKVDNNYKSINDYVGILEKPDAFLIKSINQITIDNVSYSPQGMTITDKFVILAFVNSDYTKCAIYILDKDTYEAPATLPVDYVHDSNPFVIEAGVNGLPSLIHANCLTWDPDDNIITITSSSSYPLVVLNGTTFAVSTLPYTRFYASNGYDPIRKEWVMATRYTEDDEYKYNLEVYDRSRSTILKTIPFDHKSTFQGMCCYDGLYFACLCAVSDDSTLNGYSKLAIINRDGKLIRMWWFQEKEKELEDSAMLSGDRLLVSVRDRNTNAMDLYVVTFRQNMDIKDVPSQIGWEEMSHFCTKPFPSVVEMNEVVDKTFELVSGSGFTVSGYGVLKVNRQVFVYFTLTVTAASSSSWASVGRVDESCIPIVPWYVVIPSFDTNGNSVDIRVTDNRYVQYRLGGPGTYIIHFSYPSTT